MVKSLITYCFPLIRKPQAIITLIFFEQGTTKTLCSSFRKHLAGEIMFEFPDQIICHSDSFFIGRQIQALSMDDYLIPGQTYFVLPIERFAYRILTTSSLSIFNPNLENVRGNNIFTAPSSPPPFEYCKGLDGKVLIKVSPEFIISLICKNRNGVSSQKDVRSTDLNEEAISCGESSAVCNSPELQKLYDQLVGTREWSPNLQTIKEHKIRVSPLRFIGLNRSQEEVS